MAHRPGERAPVSDQGVGDPPRRLDHHRGGRGELLAVLDVDVAYEGADRRVSAPPHDVVHRRKPADVNDQLWTREPKLEERDQALAAGHHLRVVTALLKNRKRFLQAGGSAIVKCGGKHAVPPQKEAAGPRSIYHRPVRLSNSSARNRFGSSDHALQLCHPYRSRIAAPTSSSTAGASATPTA